MRKFPSKLTKANTIDKDTNLLHLQGFQQFLPTILRYLDDKSLFEFHLTCKELRLRIRGEPTWRNRIVNRINISENNALQAAVNLGVSPSIAKDLKLEEKSVEELEKFEPIRRQVWLRTLYRLEHFFDDDKKLNMMTAKMEKVKMMTAKMMTEKMKKLKMMTEKMKRMNMMTEKMKKLTMTMMTAKMMTEKLKMMTKKMKKMNLMNEKMKKLMMTMMTEKMKKLKMKKLKLKMMNNNS
jgi:hypothetical protein